MKNGNHNQNRKYAAQGIKSAALSEIWQMLQGSAVAAQFFAAQAANNSAMQNFYLSMAFQTLSLAASMEEGVQLGGPNYEIIMVPCRRRAHFLQWGNNLHASNFIVRNNANSCIYGNVKYVYI